MKISPILPIFLAPIEALSIPGLFLEQEVISLSDSHTVTYPNCPIDVPMSCMNKTLVSDSCCFEYPGGVVLQTQFWDYYPPVGPDDLFTLHGLWPDNCDGSYEQFCDNKLNIHEDVTKILQDANETVLLDKMNKYWKNFNGKDEELWVHEFNKHGTCMTTIKPACYGDDYQENENVVDFFKSSVNLFEKLPTYEWLAGNGIVPSEDQTYTKQQIEDTLRAHFGQPVYISCNRFNALQEIWYFHHVKGSILQEEFSPIPSLLNSKCPESGIKFLPKNFKPPTPTHTNPGAPAPTGSTRRGYLKPSSQPGCIISNGKWYSSGTCATFSLIKLPFGGYNLKSSKGWCGLDDSNELSCGGAMSAMQFQFDKESKHLTYGGKKSWSLDSTPSRFKQVPISPGYDGSITFKLKLEEH